MKVRFYGKLADLLGHEKDVQIAAPCTVAELRAHVIAECNETGKSLADERVRACVSDTIVPESHVVEPGEVVEFLAPVSGG